MKKLRQISHPAKFKDELLNPYGATNYRVFELPGWEGSRRQLSFVLRVLSGRENKLTQDHLEVLLSFYFQNSTAERAQVLQAVCENPQLLESATKSLIATMQEMAEMWIVSGKNPNDRNVDTPADRNVEDILPDRSVSLLWLINHLLFEKYPRYAALKRDGTLVIKDVPPIFTDDHLSDGLEIGLEKYCRSVAAYYFVHLLDSPYSRHLARCDGCKKYFGYARARLRTVKHGVFCKDCASMSSGSRTVASRSKWLDTAARAWIEWESKRRSKDRDQWTYDSVNKAHRKSFGKRWISQNLKEIQKRAEALRNAKS